MTAKELQEGLADIGLLVHCSAVKRSTWSVWRNHEKEVLPAASAQKLRPLS